MAISMVRKPSETPNITNIDDIIPFRYAYGNQSGYVISRGAEVSHTVNGNQFTVNSGRLVIQGVESDIDSNGITLTIDSVSETRYYAVYHEINLATNTSNIKVEFDTATYPNITEGDDLTANSSGIARLVLYNFIAQNGVISGVNKVVKAIDYTGTALVGYDTSKGTVEERLTKLGFKEGSVSLSSGITATTNRVTRQGNYVNGYVSFTSGINLVNFLGVQTVEIGTLPEEFRHNRENSLGIGYDSVVTVTANTANTGSALEEIGASVSANVYITPSGTIYGQGVLSWNGKAQKLYLSAGIKITSIEFGYEANPIE